GPRRRVPAQAGADDQRADAARGADADRRDPRAARDVGLPPVRSLRLSHHPVLAASSAMRLVARAAGDLVDRCHAAAIDGFGRVDRDVAEVEITLDLGCVALVGITEAAAAR